jgi:hypothetical protein
VLRQPKAQRQSLVDWVVNELQVDDCLLQQDRVGAGQGVSRLADPGADEVVGTQHFTPSRLKPKITEIWF